MKKLIFLASALSLLIMAAACGNKNAGASADDVDSTAILDSIQRADSILRADSIQRADSQAVVTYLGQLYNLVLNNKGNYRELTSHFSAEVKKRLVAANEFEDGSMALYELRTGAPDGPSNVSKVNSITRKDGWYVVSYTDMGLPGSTKLKAEVTDGRVVITDYASADGEQAKASSEKVDEVEQAVRDFEEFYRTHAARINSGQLDPMGGIVAAEVHHVYAFEEQWTPAQRKRVEKVESLLY